jgi:hypothetical protein
VLGSKVTNGFLGCKIASFISDEVTELSSIKCTVDNWKVILDTCVQHGSEQQCLVEMERITRKNSDLNKEMKEAILQQFGTNIPFIRLVSVLFISISMILRIFILPDRKFTESSVKSPKKSTFV